VVDKGIKRRALAHPVPNPYPKGGDGKAESDKMTDPVPVSEALTPVTPFTGDKRGSGIHCQRRHDL
jgi:hypothetical protein